MEWSEQVEYCEELLAENYKISKQVAHQIISDLEIEEDVIEAYKEEISEKEKELEEQSERDYEYNLKHYNDGWKDHEGV